MYNLGCFVDSKTYNNLMRGKRKCVNCGTFALRRVMVYDSNVRGLICPKCKNVSSSNQA